MRSPKEEAIEILVDLKSTIKDVIVTQKKLDEILWVVIEKLRLPGKIHAPDREEWKEGWPRGTWVDAFGLIFMVGATARDSEGSLMYLVPASYFGMDMPPTRSLTVYAALANEARTADGQVYTREI